MRYLLFILFSLFSVGIIHGQENTVQQKEVGERLTFIMHKVQPGETLYSISKRYNLELQDISRCNPQAADGLQSGEVLKIPVRDETVDTRGDEKVNMPLRFIQHKVQRKETFYFIARKYGVTMDDILAYNPGLTRLDKGDVIRIPQWTGEQKGKQGKETGTGERQEGLITHWVQPGETLYSISRRYGKSVASILEINPQAGELKSGMRITIPSGSTIYPEKEKNKSGFIRHTIRSGETLYSVSHKYNVPMELLVEMNPGIDKTFISGTEILILGSGEKQTEDQVPEGIHHLVTKGETLSGLSQVYQVPMLDIIKYNSWLNSRPPREGDTLLIIPDRKISETAGNEHATKKDGTFRIRNFDALQTSDCNPKGLIGNTKIPVNVALLLPIMIESNRYLNREFLSGSSPDISDDSTDSTGTNSRRRGSIQFQGSSENFIHFYEGVLLAVDSLQQMGVKVNLQVYDTEQKSSEVKSLADSGELDDADLIIGPVFLNEQKELDDFILKKQIPMVSPLTASDELTSNNPWFFQVNPSRDYIAAKTYEYIISTFRNSNILVMQAGNSETSAENELRKIKQEYEKNGGSGNTTKMKICNFRKDGFAGLKESLEKGSRNVIVILSSNEADVSVVVSNIRSLASDFDITLIGTNRFPQFESINPENYHQGKLEFLTPYWPDYKQGITISFVNKFRHYFKGDPNQFSMQGYDIAFFFIKALHTYGKDFRGCISHSSAELVQGTYHFSMLPSGGFINDGLSVIHYSPSYDVIRKTWQVR